MMIIKNGLKNKFSTVTIIRTQVPQNIDLNHYFEIMNTRGEQLELHEIVKARFWVLSSLKMDSVKRTKKIN